MRAAPETSVLLRLYCHTHMDDRLECRPVAAKAVTKSGKFPWPALVTKFAILFFTTCDQPLKPAVPLSCTSVLRPMRALVRSPRYPTRILSAQGRQEAQPA